jgi:uncharacterized protein (TIGR00297 family)
VVERTTLGLLLAASLSAAAFRLRALSLSGAIAAVFIGTTVLGAGGWTPAMLLVLFFGSSSLFTRFSSLLKPERQAAFAKGGRRDARQVLANGVLPALLALSSLFYPQGSWLPAIIGALAAATADTWATEWGILARHKPRRITDWENVPPGTSGGITPLGTLGSLIGALVIGVAASLLEGRSDFILIGLFSGALGSALDSLLGATIQVQYFCEVCDKATEQHPIHRTCGTETGYHSGILWVDNDTVNLFANAFGALIASIWLI